LTATDREAPPSPAAGGVAGPEAPLTAGRDAVLRAFLRRALACPEATGLVLRGSLLLDALCPGARAPQDVDYLVLDPFDPAAYERLARAIVATPDPASGPPLAFDRAEIIFGETTAPGLRAFVRSGDEAFQIDLASNDPLPEPPRPIDVVGVGPVLACTPETLFGWKLHGLVERGRGRWRPKDLFDLYTLHTRLPLAPGPARAAIELAFSSRDTPLWALDDLRGRPAWGQSSGGARLWRVFVRRNPGANAPDFVTARDAVRAALDAFLGPAPGA
jgi:nucleotidyltransferase AbiEii toxin of type IV toxin-antitoxin system